MTFLEAALEILKRERKPLHFKELTERAMEKKLLTFVGRTPEVTMQTQLTNAVKKAPGQPFVRVKPGIFGLLRYPEAAAEPEQPASNGEKTERKPGADADADATTDARTPGGRRRRRGGRGRSRSGEGRTTLETAEGVQAAPAAAPRSGRHVGSEETEVDEDPDLGDDDEPEVGAMSAEARAAALSESGMLGGDEEGEGEGDDDDDDADDDDAGDDAGDDESETPVAASAAGSERGGTADGDADARTGAAPREASGDERDEGDEGDDEGDGELEAGAAGVGEARGALDDAAAGRRRRRRRRRRRGGENGTPEAFGTPGAAAGEGAQASFDSSGEGGPGPVSGGEAVPAESSVSSSGDGAATSGDGGSAARRIMSPTDAAIEILKGQAPGRGVHVRQIADAAVRRRLVHGEPNEAWRVMRAALAAEPRERLRQGLRPRVRPAGSGLYALARRPPDMDLEKSEYVFGEARRALRERTSAALEQRLCELSPSAFEAIGRVLLQREGLGPATFVKRVEGTIYLEALRGRGSRPSKCLIALRPGTAAAGRRAIGELRAGLRARSQDEGLLMLAGRLAEDAVAEWRQPGAPVEVIDGPAMADTCVRHGIGVVPATVNVEFVDADFFAELSEG